MSSFLGFALTCSLLKLRRGNGKVSLCCVGYFLSSSATQSYTANMFQPLLQSKCMLMKHEEPPDLNCTSTRSTSQKSGLI